MGLKIGISIDSAGTFDQVTALLAPSTVRSDLYRAMNEAIAKTRTAASKDVRGQFRMLKASDLAVGGSSPVISFFGKMAGKDSLSASFGVKGRRTTLGRYGTSSVSNFGRQSKPPRFQVKGGRGMSRSLASTFAVANFSLPNRPNLSNAGKGYQIVEREGGNVGYKFRKSRKTKQVSRVQIAPSLSTVKKVVPKKGRYAGKVYVRGPLKGQPYRRQPITVLRNIAVSEAYNTKRQGAVSYSQLIPIFEERMISRIESSFKSQLKRQFKKLF